MILFCAVCKVSFTLPRLMTSNRATLSLLSFSCGVRPQISKTQFLHDHMDTLLSQKRIPYSVKRIQRREHESFMSLEVWKSAVSV